MICIISGGFKEYILPVAARLGLPDCPVYANTFVWKEDGTIAGADPNNPMAHAGGKVNVLRSMTLPYPVTVIGDGYTDYEIKQAGLAASFWLFTENCCRSQLIPLADRVLNSLDDLFLTHP